MDLLLALAIAFALLLIIIDKKQAIHRGMLIHYYMICGWRR